MADQAIPDDVRERAIAEVMRLNAELLNPEAELRYVPRFRGKHVYLDRAESGHRPESMCRLTYTGDFQGWQFAIFKYSDMRYDPEEWLFPGAQWLDGTIEGAIRATLEAYPG